MITLMVECPIDKTMQKSLFYPASKKNRPLLVALHTWSFDEYNQEEYLLSYATKHDWNLLLPRFRGPNKPTNNECKKACGSEYAIADIIASTKVAIDECDADLNSIFLFGGSGGAQAALLTIAKEPKLWSKAIAYVPIFDLKMWLDENLEKGSDFSQDIISCVGDYESNAQEYQKRSPLYHIDEIALVNDLKIYVGKYDDIVSYKQGVRFFNEMMEKHPCAKVFFEFFDGGHFVNYNQVISYFDGSYVAGTLDLSK